LNKKQSIVALIPARSGSKRITDKNIKLLDGHPLIAYTINIALQSKIFNNVVVSTDSMKYKKIAQYYGATVISRPKKYSKSDSPDIEWVTHLLDQLKQENKKYNLFSILRPTSPFRSVNMITDALNSFLKHEKADSLRAVEKCSQHPAKMWYLKENKLNSILIGDSNGVPWHSCQSNTLPIIYMQNASLEIAKSSVIYNKNSISGEYIIPYITNKYEGYDINTHKDWVFAKYLINQEKNLLPKIDIKPYPNIYDNR